MKIIFCIFGLVCLAVYAEAVRCFNCQGKDCRTGEVECNSAAVRNRIAAAGLGTITPYCYNATDGTTYALSCGTTIVTNSIPLGCSTTSLGERVCKCNTNGCNSAGTLTYSALTMFALLMAAKFVKYQI